MSSVIKKIDSIAGVRHWMQIYAYIVPRYEVFRVIGHNPSTGLYYFQSVKHDSTVSKYMYQLNTNGFKPYCLDWSRITKHVEEGVDPYAPL